MEEEPKQEMSNPWLVNSIQEFNFLCCPECDYRSKNEAMFTEHAIGTHPMSKDFFDFMEEVNVKLEPMEEDVDVKLEPQVIIKEEKEKNMNYWGAYRVDLPAEETDPIPCSICKESFESLWDVAIHYHEIHALKRELLKCPTCDFTSKLRGKLRKHIHAKHETPARVACRLCHKVMTRNGHIFHMKTKHNFAGQPKEEKMYNCTHCDFTSKHKHYVNSHILKIHEKFNHKYHCEKCSQSFAFNSELKIHMKRHEPKPPKASKEVNCPECHKTFHSEQYLRMHYDHLHKESRPLDLPHEGPTYICDQCPKTYTNPLSLKHHVEKFHSKKKSAPKERAKKVCQHCAKTFINEKNYVEHVKSKHEKITPFHCDLCTRSFATKVVLMTHKRNMHERVRCDDCGKEMCNNFILRKHKATVHQTLPKDAFQCQYCPQFYVVKTMLDQHLESVHQHKLEQDF